MKEDYLQILVCPVCKSALKLTSAVIENDEVKSGSLHCSRCNYSYHVNDGIPCMLPPESLQGE